MATLEGPLDFTGTNGDPAIAGWDKYYSSGASSWEILTNQLVQATEYGIHVAAYDGAIDSDQWIELDINDRASEGSFGIGLRHVSGDGTTVSNGVECFISTDGSGSLYSNTGGELDTFTSATPPYTLRLEAEGSAVTLYRDDVEIASGTLGGGYRTSGAPFIYMGDTWQFLDNPMDNLSVGDFASSGAEVSPAEAVVTIVSDGGSITQTHTVSPADAVVTVVSDGGSVTQTHVVSPGEATVTVVSDGVVVSSTTTAAPAEAVVDVVADAVSVTQTHVVSPSDAVVTVVADGVSVSSGFTPADLAGLLGWWDASDASTITESSGQVSQWRDKSGNDYHANQGTGIKQPITGTRTLNGLNVLDFDGTDDGLSCGDVMDLGTNGITMVGVMRSDAVQDWTLAGKTEASGASGRYAMFRNGTMTFLYSHDGTGSAFADVADSSTAARVLSMRLHRDGASSTNEMRENGMVLQSKSFTDAGGNVNTSFPFTIGFYASAEILPLNGYIAELVVCSGAISTDDLTDLETYLSDKWLTPATSVSPADAVVIVASDGASVTQTHVVSPADAVVTVVSDGATVTQTHVVSPGDATVTVTADTATITQTHVVAPGEAVVVIVADTVQVISDGPATIQIQVTPLNTRWTATDLTTRSTVTPLVARWTATDLTN